MNLHYTNKLCNMKKKKLTALNLLKRRGLLRSFTNTFSKICNFITCILETKLV